MNLSLSTTQKQLYIIETAPPFERLEVQFMPSVLKWDRRGDVASIAVVGRNNPHYELTGGEDTLDFRVDFYSEREDRSDVIRKVRWLQSLLYNDGGRQPVRNVRIAWGDLFRREVWVCRGARAEFDSFMPNAGMLPQQAYVDLSFALDPKTNLLLSDVRR